MFYPSGTLEADKINWGIMLTNLMIVTSPPIPSGTTSPITVTAEAVVNGALVSAAIIPDFSAY